MAKCKNYHEIVFKLEFLCLKSIGLARFMETTEAIKMANAAFYRAMESGVLEKMTDLWAHEDYVKCVHPGWDLIVGWHRVRESWEQLFAGEQRMRVSPTNVYVFYSGDLAWVTCTENITVFQDTDFDTVQAVATNLFIERQGKWLMIQHHASIIPMLVADTETDIIQ